MKSTSAAVSGLPSDQTIPSLRVQVMVVRSSETPPFSTVGISAASDGHHVAVLVVAGERLEDQRGGLDVLGAAREVGVEVGRRLPVQDVEFAVAAPLGKGSSGEHRHGCEG